MDDATASDNCGEVTIEVSSETCRRCRGNYVIVRTFTATDDAGNSALPPKQSPSKTPPLLSSPSSLPTTVECSDEMRMDDATASDNCGEVTIGERNDCRRCRGQLRLLPSATDAPETTALRPRPIDTTAPEFTFVPADYTVGTPTRCQWTMLWRRTTAVR